MTFSGERQDRDIYPDTRVMLHQDEEALEVLGPVIVADADRFYAVKDIDLQSPYRQINSALSFRGHVANGHILPAVDHLFKNLPDLTHCYGIRLPDGVTTKDEFLEMYKGPFINITAYDVLHILHEYGMIEHTPEEAFDLVEGMKQNYHDLMMSTLNGHRQRHMLGLDGRPLFGLSVLRNIRIDDKVAFWVGNAHSLIMDAPYYRAMSGLNMGFGYNVAVDLEAMASYAGTEWGFDLKSLSRFDTRNFLGLSADVDPLRVLEKFDQIIWPELVARGIVYDRVVEHGPGITDGYVRIQRGYDPFMPGERDMMYGSADSMSNIFAGFIGGRPGFAGMVGGDAWDTAEGLGRLIYPGGHDSALFDELMSDQKFRDAVSPYLTPDHVKTFLRWSREAPPHEAQGLTSPPSCSQRYLNEVMHSQGHEPFTTLEIELWILDHLKQFVEGTGVPREIPDHTIGFEQVGSGVYYQNLFQKTKRYLKEGLFPDGAWIYSQLN